MKSRILLLSAAFGMLLMFTANVFGQSSTYAKQVITSNSGKFEFSPPYTDFVTLQSFNPQSKLVNNFGAIFTQSSQSMVFTGSTGFFAAQDSIVKYDLNTLKRRGAVADSGLNRMIIYKGRLLISRQYPVSQHFFEVRDTSDLSLIAEVTGISGDCGGVCVVRDTVYVAVNGGWMGTEGKLAIIDPSTWTLKTEVALGSDAIGILDLYVWNDFIYSVNKTPYGMPDVGSVTNYDPSNRHFTNNLIPFKVGAGAGQSGGFLYLGLANGIGSFNMGTLKVADTVVVADPGSAMFTYILSAVVDSITGRLYTNIGDYATPGYCLVTSLAGDSLTSYATGISSDAIAVDYRMSGAGIHDNSGNEISLTLYPNPVTDRLKLSFSARVALSSIRISDLGGRTLKSMYADVISGTALEVDVTSLEPGMYYLIAESPDGRIVRPFAVARR